MYLLKIMSAPTKDLDVKYLSGIRNSTLFYPCSGGDLLEPIHLFSPFVTDFWFADRGYFRPGHQDTRRYGLDVPADKLPPVLGDDKSYRLLDTHIVGEPGWRQHSVHIPPCVLTETYEHIPSGCRISIHLRRGYALSTLRKEIRSLGVFFYRGDSEGEGGSGHYWLGSKQLAEILPMLVNGGLVVTDGSQGGPSNGQGQYSDLVRLHGKRPEKDGVDLVGKIRPFRDKAGRSFECIGQAGQRYGPTLIWRVTRSADCD
jgi:hypothetical protein